MGKFNLGGITIADGNKSVLQLDSAANLLVNVNAALPTGTNSIGQVTANAGTNLNTSALALEAGNLLAIKNSVANIPALGQALATGSVPVVLTAAQLTTLTPPSNTGYALDSSLSTINTSLADVATLGAKTDAKSTATDATSVSIMQVLKEISAMVQAPASTPVTNTGTFAVQSTPVTQADTFMLGGVNIKEINAVTPLMGNGVTGTGSLRVTIASDNTAFAVNATLSAETTKVIGVVRTADGSGNLLTSTSQALDVNIKSETAPAVSLVRVAIAASASGDNTLIAAVTNKKIYVVAFELSFSGTVNAKFTDGAGGTNLGGLYYGVANAGAAQSVAPDMKLAIPSPYIWAGSVTTALILNLSGATAVGGAITYFTV